MNRHHKQIRRDALLLLAFAVLLAGVTCALGQQRFPPPDFESGHKLPLTTAPEARAWALSYLDIAVLAGCLSVATWLVHSKRSRKAVVGLSLFSLLYFGFWRKGCVCSIGSVQNVALALTQPAYALPISVLAFFVLPIVIALLFGRSFCAGVCPHGALQDLVLLKPLKVPGWLDEGLSLLPFFYLGAGVLFAATGSAFIFCEYDPFVPIFRLNGRLAMVLAGGVVLLLGMFVGRPYCRFLCPYGAVLKLCSLFSRWKIRTTPNQCTQCRLCEETCPFGALRRPETFDPATHNLGVERRQLSIFLACLPLFILAGGLIGGQFSRAAARVHPTVALAEQYLKQKDNPVKTGVLSPEELALERFRQDPEELLRQARTIQKRMTTGAWIFGAWVGAVIGFKLLTLSLGRSRRDFEPDQGACVACARCFESCPNELIRRGGVLQPSHLAAASDPGASIPTASALAGTGTTR